MTAPPAADQLRPIRDFLARLPPGRAGRRVPPSTAARWIKTGVRLPDGSRLKLRAVRAGQKWLCTEAAWAEFLAAQTAAFAGGHRGEAAHAG